MTTPVKIAAGALALYLVARYLANRISGNG
jgi:hypothetical protein